MQDDTTLAIPLTREIPLTRGKVALIDDHDFQWLNQHDWHAKHREGRWYAQRCRRQSEPEGPTVIFMHRAILCAPKGIGVDHKNGDGLDNRRENLRLATDAQNQLNRGKTRHNTSGFKGVSRKDRRWQARACLRGRMYHLGCFDTPEEAARAYDKFAKERHGEFAHPNFTEELAP